MLFVFLSLTYFTQRRNLLGPSMLSQLEGLILFLHIEGVLCEVYDCVPLCCMPETNAK